MVEGQEGVSWQDWLGLARACEEAGLEGLFRSDHYLPTIAPAASGGLDAWATLAALAARTERIRLGTLVSPVTFRHPSLLAKMAVTVDHISRGRVEVGLGAGWFEAEHTAFGFPFPEVGERMTMLAEQLEIVSRSWREEEVSFQGRHYQLQGARMEPKPVQKPRPPLILGGSGGPRSAALAARYADEYNTFLATLEEVRERRARVVEACERAGRDPASLTFSLMTACVVGADRAELLQRVGALLRFLGAEGEDPEAVLRDRSEQWLAGTPEEVVSRLGELAQAGVERVHLQHLLHRDLEMVALIGAEVAPAVSG
jgi:F420-dependent oxidoreductase-like protein